MGRSKELGEFEKFEEGEMGVRVRGRSRGDDLERGARPNSFDVYNGHMTHVAFYNIKERKNRKQKIASVRSSRFFVSGPRTYLNVHFIHGCKA